MKLKDLIEDIEKIEIDADSTLCLSQVLVLDEDHWGVADLPIIGVSYKENDHEIRFVIDGESAQLLKLAIQYTKDD